MKCTSVILWLIASSFCLFNGCYARVEAMPYDLKENGKPPAEKFVEKQPRESDCQVPIRNGLAKPQPVYLTPDAAEIFPFSDAGVMELNAGESLQLWCGGDFEQLPGPLITATCQYGVVFKVDGAVFSIKQLNCKSWPSFTAEKTGASCNGGSLVRVGYQIDFGRFVQQMEVCFDESEEVTRYVRYDLSAAADYYETGVDRINFQTAGFFVGKNVDDLYSQNSQIETISGHLGVESNKYFNIYQSEYLARGHIGAKADFMFGTQQRATFLFINVAPQWQAFNAGNWQRVEDSLRQWISQNEMAVEVYAGVWGVSSLPNAEGEQTPLYLSYDGNNNGFLPVPKIFFRVVIEPSTQRGIVFVGVNNIHATLEEVQNEYVVCEDVSDLVDYIDWYKKDITVGYSYACEVSDFMATVTDLPNLSAVGGLLI